MWGRVQAKTGKRFAHRQNNTRGSQRGTHRSWMECLGLPMKTQDRSMEAIMGSLHGGHPEKPTGRPWTNVRHGAQDERFS